VTFDLVLSEGRIVTPGAVIERGWVGVRDGQLAAIEPGAAPETGGEVHDLAGAWLGPGFIDVHVHGSVGIDVMDADEHGLAELSRFVAAHGVTSFLVGTYTMERERTLRSLETVANAVGRAPGGASILGAYMEGPFLNPLRKGMQDERHLRPIDRAEAMQYLETGVVCAMVLAPELPDSDWLIQKALDRGATVAAGHTDATYAELKAAVAMGVTSVTHAFNGMRGLHHREPGAAGASLLLDGLACEVIADGVHIAPELLQMFWRMKGPHNIALVTDAGSFGGMPDGTYTAFVDRVVTIAEGVGRLPDGTICSSARTYDFDFSLFSTMTHASFDEIWPTASEVPARLAGCLDRKGTLEIGKDADLVALDRSGKVEGVAALGEWIPRAEASPWNGAT
jgi:N-acetylglucosamine-6-phosphate deacetylase